MDHPKGLTFSG